MDHTRKYYDTIIDIRKLQQDSYMQQYDLLHARIDSLKAGCCSNLLCMDLEVLENSKRVIVDAIEANRITIDTYENIVYDMIP
jgi:hypothetical protein